MEEIEKIRLQKHLSKLGICSRREAEQLILDNKVIINGQIANLGAKVNMFDEIYIDGKSINKNEYSAYKYILFNKPKNLICTRKDPQNRKTIYEYLNIKEHIYSIGRLDYNTTGVILLTNDGDFANMMAHPSNRIKRTYIATLEKPLSQFDIEKLNGKNFILNGKLSLQNVKLMKGKTYSISLNEGRNHHIKNIFLSLDNKVVHLHRKKYGIFDDSDLNIGSWKEIDYKKINEQKKLLNEK